MQYDHKTYLLQIGLQTLKFDPGPADGLFGKNTKKAFEASRIARFGSKSEAQSDGTRPPRPGPTTRDKVRIFGQKGREGALKKVTLPWPMKIVGMPGNTRTTIRAHKLIADLYIEALQDILKTFGIDYIRRYGLDLFSGDFVDRPTRGGSSPSDHSWGIALDLNGDANGNRTTWEPGKKAANGTLQISVALVKTFQKYGFQVGFRRSDGTRRDMMHIAYVNRK